MKDDILLSNALEYFQTGEEAFLKQRYNSSVVLFFKSLVSFTDLFLFKKMGQTPSSHSNRFLITKKNFPRIYDLLDKDFPFYQESYVKNMSKELAEVIREDARSVAKQTGIKV